MAVTWPASLPLPQKSGHGHSKASGQSSNGFTAGNIRRRQSRSTPATLFTVTWLMTTTQLNTFIAFWQAAGDFGAADIDGMQLMDHTGLCISGSANAPSVHFVGEWTATRVGTHHHSISAQIERSGENIGSHQDYANAHDIA